MDALLTAITIWLSANFGLPATFDHPRVVYVPSTEMATLRFKATLSTPSHPISNIQGQEASIEKIRRVVAVYNNRTKTIYLPKGWSGRTAAELSILVHEMVHHLQHKARTRFECPADREKVAYEAQGRWLSLFGRSLEQEFDINGLTLLISTSCAMASGLQ
jgi:AMMECR1 domain-containing protein